MLQQRQAAQLDQPAVQLLQPVWSRCLCPTLLLDTACRARHADGPPSVYPLELTVLFHSEHKFECSRKLPGYQGPLTSNGG